jgi:hypothetical protein
MGDQGINLFPLEFLLSKGNVAHEPFLGYYYPELCLD